MAESLAMKVKSSASSSWK